MTLFFDSFVVFAPLRASKPKLLKLFGFENFLAFFSDGVVIESRFWLLS